MDTFGPSPCPQVAHGLARSQGHRTKTLLFDVISVAETPRKAEPALRGEDPSTGWRQMGACSPQGGRRAQQQKEPPTHRKAQSQADAHSVQGARAPGGCGRRCQGREPCGASCEGGLGPLGNGKPAKPSKQQDSRVGFALVETT